MLKFILFIFFTISAPLHAFAEDELLEQKIKTLVRSKAGDTNIGIYVWDLNSKSTKFALHEHRKFIPASTAKLFTAYAALSYLGPEHQLKTTFSADKEMSTNGTLRSNLYIKFSGDPTLTYENLVDAFQKVGIEQINGDVIINRSMFDDNTSAPGGFTWDNQPFYYAAPKSAAIINKNCSQAWMEPSSMGRLAKLDIDDPKLLTIINTVETVKPSSTECPYKSRYIGSNKYEVYGCMFDNLKGPVKLNFALPDNDLMVQQYIRRLFDENKIHFRGKFKTEAGEGKYILYKHESPPVKDLLLDVLRDSCNLSSSALFKYMAAVRLKKQGTDEDGEIIMKEFLLSRGIENGSFKIKDGAGESRYNLVTPHTLTKALINMYNDKALKGYIVELLPQYGLNGTVKYRQVKGPCLNCDVYAKTGTLQNNSALAGFYLPPRGKKYAFAIMINNHGLQTQEVKELEDSILHLLLTN